MPANYNCLLFDLDGTLLDFHAAEREAIAATLRMHGLPDDPDTLDLYAGINAEMWAMLERGEIKKEKLVVRRFQKLLDALSCSGDAVRINNDYLTQLAEAALPMPGAEELLCELAEFATLAATTNGIRKVQLRRLEKSGLLPYFDGVFVSEALGVTKPHPRFFEMALKDLGVRNRQRVLVVGDSLGADVKGGNAAGLATCWMNFAGDENTTENRPTYTVQDYTELKRVAVGEEELKLAETREKRHIV